MPERAEELPLLDRVPYGIWGCAVRTGAGPAAIIVTWLTRLSFEPALIGVSFETRGRFLEEVLQAGEFTLSALPRKTGKSLARKILSEGMSRRRQANGGIFSREADWREAVDGALAAIHCRVVDHHEAGDHTLVVGMVVREHHWKSGEVLRLSDTGWKYRAPVTARHRKL